MTPTARPGRRCSEPRAPVRRPGAVTAPVGRGIFGPADRAACPASFFFMAATGEEVIGIIVMLVVLLAVIVVVAAGGAMIARRYRSEEERDADGFTLSDLRRLHREGQLTDEEFERARARIIEQARRALQRDADAEAESADDLPDDGADSHNPR